MRSTETGAALIITLMLTALLALAGGALVFYALGFLFLSIYNGLSAVMPLPAAIAT